MMGEIQTMKFIMGTDTYSLRVLKKKTLQSKQLCKHPKIKIYNLRTFP